MLYFNPDLTRINARFEVAIAAITAVTIPPLVVASLFGMNVPGVPQYPFWPTVGVLLGISGASLIVLLLIWWFFFRTKSKKQYVLNKRIKAHTSSLSTQASSSNPYHNNRTPLRTSQARAQNSSARALTGRPGIVVLIQRNISIGF